MPIPRIMPTLMAGLALASCSTTPAVDFAIMPAWTTEMKGLEHFSLGSGMQLYVQNSPIVDGDDIRQATAAVDQMNAPAVLIDLEPAAAGRMGRFTAGHVSEPLAVFVDGELFSAPVVQSALGNTFLITGFASADAARNFTTLCNEAAARRGD